MFCVRRFSVQRRVFYGDRFRPETLRSGPDRRLVFSLLEPGKLEGCQGGVRIEGGSRAEGIARGGQIVTKNGDHERIRIPVGLTELAGLTVGDRVFVFREEESILVIPAPDGCQRCAYTRSLKRNSAGQICCSSPEASRRGCGFGKRDAP